MGDAAVNKDRITARPVDNWPKEPTFGPSTCSVCGKSTPLPGNHQCDPTYADLQSQLAAANEENRNLSGQLAKEMEARTPTLEALANANDEKEQMHEENKRLRKLLQETVQPLYKTYNSDCLGPKSLPCRIEKKLRGS